MTRITDKTAVRRQKILTPKWMDDGQKRMFKSVCRQVIDRQRYATKSDIELVTDYVEARARVAKLRMLLAAENTQSPEGSIRIVSLCSQRLCDNQYCGGRRCRDVHGESNKGRFSGISRQRAALIDCMAIYSVATLQI